MYLGTPDVAIVILTALAFGLALTMAGAAGFWLSISMSARDGERGMAARQVPQDWQHVLLANVERCRERGRQTVEQADLVARLLGTLVASPPEQLCRAMQRIVTMMRELAECLDRMHATTHGILGSEWMPCDSNGGTVERFSPQTTRVDSAAALPTRKLLVPDNQQLTREEMRAIVQTQRQLSSETKHYETRRYPFYSSQKIAPFRDAGIQPAQEDFSPVRCHDISVDGISFFWPTDPDFQQAVISIGEGDREIFMVIEVCNRRAVYMHDEVMYRVGCRFIRRLDDVSGTSGTSSDVPLVRNADTSKEPAHAGTESAARESSAL